MEIKERDSNYGTIFSLWDRVMGTLVAGVDQAGIRIGVGGHLDQAKLVSGAAVDLCPSAPAVR